VNQPVAFAGVKPLEDRGSIIIVVATDAPLLPTQTKRLARRAPLGLASLGATSGNRYRWPQSHGSPARCFAANSQKV